MILSKRSIQDRFTGWRRKSEPGFQSYVCLNHSDEEQKEETGADAESTTAEIKETILCSSEEDQKTATFNSSSTEAKENNNEQHTTPAQTVEEIVGHILMQNQEFQKLLEKQRTNSIINVRQHRFNKRIIADTSDDSDSENANYIADPINTNNNNCSNNNNNNNRLGRSRVIHREQRLIRTNNAWNSLSSASTRENQPLQLFYDNLKTVQKTESSILMRNSKANHVHEKRALFEVFKRQSIVTESKVIKTALQIRENSMTSNDVGENVPSSPTRELNHRLERKEINSSAIATEQSNDEKSDVNDTPTDAESKGFGNYDNLQHVWESLQTEKDVDGNDSPTQPAVWLTKLCEGLPTSPPKCGSLPRSFQMSPNCQPSVTKSRFLQRDGKPMNERPFTIASDKPAEINLEDMERYASTCQPEGRIAKFPMPVSTSSSSSSTFFCSLEDTTLNDAYSDVRISVNSANIHPDHKIYRANGGSAIFKNVLSKAGSRLQGLRNTMSTETLECSDELERTRYFRSLGASKCQSKRRSKPKHVKEPFSDVEEVVGCASASISDQRMPLLYYKQGSSSLGARIAQSDYADPTILFAESKRGQSSCIEHKATELEEKNCEEEVNSNKNTAERHESETDSFYERCFETIENYADADVDDAFRDSAIFSDVDEIFLVRQPTELAATKTTQLITAKVKIAPPIPAKRKQEMSMISRCKPSIARKPDYLRIKSVFTSKGNVADDLEASKITARLSLASVNNHQLQDERGMTEADRDDVSMGQSQAGWVRKIVGQLQGHIET